MARRVVLTGMGPVTPLGFTEQEFIKRLLSGESAVTVDPALEGIFDGPASAQVPETKFQELHQRAVTRAHCRYNGVTNLLGYIQLAAYLALQDAGLLGEVADRPDVGTVISAGGVGNEDIYRGVKSMYDRGDTRKVPPFAIFPGSPFASGGSVNMIHGITGPSLPVNAACATGIYTIYAAALMIKSGVLNVALVGSGEDCTPAKICPFDRGRFLSRSDRPAAEKCRPFDRDRDGFVPGSGAACFVLEEYEHAKKRGAPIVAELTGWAVTNDGTDMLRPSGDGIAAAMRAALSMSGYSTVDYLSAHATATEVGDPIEATAIKQVFGDEVPYFNSIKGQVGHGLGGAASGELFAALAQARARAIAATANLNEIAPEIEELGVGHRIARKVIEKPIRRFMKISLGFGGFNGAVTFEMF